MIENGSMERVSSSMPEGWSAKNLSSSDRAVTSSYRYGSHSFSISPDASKSKELYQDISVKGNEGDTYVLSGWSKGYGILESDDSRKYKISVQVFYSDDTYKWKTPAEFTYAVGDWKYAATSFNLGDGTSAEKTPERIRICLRSHGQANTVCYDGIQLTRKNVDICSYDDNGNLKKSGKDSYTYENNLIKTSTDSTGKKTTYDYYTGTSKILKISDDRSSAITTYAYDSYGNITGEAYKKSDGTLIARYIYDAYGNEIKREYGESEARRGIANINPFRYRGYMYDSETGYYYLMSRYYNPTIGRFVSAEPNIDNGLFDEGEGIIMYNLYAYCANNPVMFVDIRGESISIATCVVLGMIIGGITGAVASKLIYGKVNGWRVLSGIAIGGVLGYIGGAFFGASGIKGGTLASKIKMSKVRWIGKIGEQMSKWPKNTVRIDSSTRSAKYRIPDYLNFDKKVLGEVKNVKRLSFTKQIEDFMLYSEKNGLTFIIKVRKTTQFSPKLKTLIDAGRIAISYIK